MKNTGLPVLLLAFNRPDKLENQLVVLNEMGMHNIYISVDGPRNSDDIDACSKVNKMVRERIGDDSRLLIRENNLGCKLAVKSGIDWFFSHVDFGVILEDDCIPCIEFFDFCAKMGRQFSHNENIFAIQGNRFSPPAVDMDAVDLSYNFYMWGWATWSNKWNAWSLRDLKVELKSLQKPFDDFFFYLYWNKIRKQCNNGEFNSWGYPTAFYCFDNGLFNITPPVNLVVNEGFDAAATHTQKSIDLPFNNFLHTNKYYDYDYELITPRVNRELFADECKYRLHISLYTKVRLLVDSYLPCVNGLLSSFWSIFNIIKKMLH